MKFLYISICALLLVTGAKAQQAQKDIEYLDLGTKVSNYPKVTWLQGTPVTTFEKDKIYIVELWATWCVPCIKAMPHLNQLHNKFKDKNVVFIAQDVMEESQEKVEKFLAEKPERLSFTVGFAGAKGNDFDKRWLQAAGVNSIPQTFIIQNNTLVWQTSPDMVTEETLQLLVDGKFTIDAAKAIAAKQH